MEHFKNGQSKAAWFVNKIVSENKKAYGEIVDIISGKPTQPGKRKKTRVKAKQNSMRARFHNNLEMLEPNNRDQVSLSPEAQALLG